MTEKDKEKGPENPKAFEVSGEDMDDLLSHADEIVAAASGGEKKKGARPGSRKGSAKEGGGEADETLRRKAEERDQYLDRLQRVQAEYLNFQKRTRRERSEWTERALVDFLEKLLPLLDDFEGARRTMGTKDPEALRKGIQILRDHLWKILSDVGVKEIPAQGEVFDPRLHEAVLQDFSPDAEDGVILEVLQPGYAQGDRVLRPTRVKIARKGEPPTSATPEPPEDESPREEEAKGGGTPRGEAPAEDPQSGPSGNPLLDEPEERPHA